MSATRVGTATFVSLLCGFVGGLVSSGAATLAGVETGAAAQDVLRVRQLVIVDDEGKVRGEFGFRRGDSFLRIRGDGGEVSITTSLGPSVDLEHSQGQSSVSLSARDGANACLSLTSGDKGRSVSLWAGKNVAKLSAEASVSESKDASENASVALGAYSYGSGQNAGVHARAPGFEAVIDASTITGAHVTASAEGDDPYTAKMDVSHGRASVGISAASDDGAEGVEMEAGSPLGTAIDVTGEGGSVRLCSGARVSGLSVQDPSGDLRTGLILSDSGRGDPTLVRGHDKQVTMVQPNAMGAAISCIGSDGEPEAALGLLVGEEPNVLLYGRSKRPLWKAR